MNIVGICDYNNQLLTLAVQFLLRTSSLPLAGYKLAIFTKTPHQGGQTSVHCSIAPEIEGVSGKYWSDCALKGPPKRALDDEECKRLWEYSEKVGL